MAYIQNQNTLTDDQQQPTDAPDTGGDISQGLQTSNGTGDASLSAASPQGAKSMTATTKAPPVQNLQAYLKANAPQAVQMGTDIANNLNQTVNQVSGDINSAQQTVGKTVQDQNIAPDVNLVNQAAQDPSQFVQDPNNVTAFQRQRDANYGGPANFESTDYYPTLNQQVSNAQQKAPDITKQGGVQQLARGQEKNPTTGMSNLDALLLQESPEALKPIQNVIPKFGALSGQLSTAASTTNDAIQQAILNAQKSKAGVQDRFFTGDNAVVPGFETGIQNAVTQAQQGATKYNQSVADVIEKENAMQGILSGAQSAIGDYNAQNYDPESAQVSSASTLPKINYDLSSLSKAPDKLGAASADTVATQKDYDTEAALNKLLGIDLPTLNQANRDKAGSYKVPANASLDTQGAITGLQSALDAANKGFTNNGALQYSGTPSGSVITNKDIPPGYQIVPASAFQANNHGTVTNTAPEGTIPLGQGDRFGQNYIAVPPGTTIPKSVADNGGKVLTVGETGNTFAPSSSGGTPSLGGPAYYSNQPLNQANDQISQLIKYLQGIS